jgi:hypothetical protein
MNKITQQISGATLSLWTSKKKNSEKRVVFGYEIILDNKFKYRAYDLKSGANRVSGSLKEGMKSLLSFLGAAGESFNYAERKGNDGMTGENSELFPREITEWAANNSDELAMAQIESQEIS